MRVGEQPGWIATGLAALAIAVASAWLAGGPALRTRAQRLALPAAALAPAGVALAALLPATPRRPGTAAAMPAGAPTAAPKSATVEIPPSAKSTPRR